MINKEEIEKRFYPAKNLTAIQKLFINDVNSYFVEIATKIDNICPDCRQKSIAFTKLQEAKFWIVDSIAKEME